MTDHNENSQPDDQRSEDSAISRRGFLGSSAVTAGALTLSGSATASASDDTTTTNDGGLSTTDIMDLSLDLIGADEVPPDTGIFVEGTDIETALVGIDIESAELQLADRMNYDVAIAHHPAGGDPIVDFADIFDRGVELMVNQGVSEDRAEEAVADMRESWRLNGVASNYRHEPSIAELLDQPYMNIHRPIDELSRRAFVEIVDNLSEDETVSDLKDAFNEALPEVRAAKPDITTALGSDENDLGDIAVYHAAGTNGGASVARAFYESGFDTVIYIHVGSSDVQELRDEFGDEKNLVVTGHVVGDGIGFGILIDELQARGVDVTAISGAGIGREDC